MLDFKGKRLHFIGVGGVGVNALARFSLDMGGRVSGSDVKVNHLIDDLQKRGASVWQGECACNMQDADIVVYSSAIKCDNEELAFARENGADVYERHEFLREVSRLFNSVIAIGGTHGKTTTTSMLTHVLLKEGVNFIAMIGGESVEFAHYVNNIKEGQELKDCVFVCEACEYKKSLLSLNPTIGVVTNSECDHPDCYNTIDDVDKVFEQFLSQSKLRIAPINYASRIFPKTYKKESLAIKHKDREMVVVIGDNHLSLKSGIFDGDTDIKCVRISQDACNVLELKLQDGSRYNYSNAMLALCASQELGIDNSHAIKALATYKGVKRRFERSKDVDGVRTFFDFAHHPSEIESLLSRSFDNALFIFQPHTYSRTKAYFEDYIRVLTNSKISTLILMPTYEAREDENMGYNSSILYGALLANKTKKHLYLAKDYLSTLDLVKSNAKEHDIILFVGAGDIYDLKDIL